MTSEPRTFIDEEAEILPSQENADRVRAEQAMKPVVDTPAGSAEGVGSIGFGDPGVFEIGAADDEHETERQAPGA